MLNRKWRGIVARTLILVMAGNPVILAAYGVERTINDPAATGEIKLAEGQQAAIKTSANGTTVVDIAAPSLRGVSHNRFASFNVPTEGVILNNSKDPLVSVLGGWTDGNRRLTGGTAGIILNEVTGESRSSLLGYTEILGDAAEFVLANPNGITCNGCGFINTPRVTFATGIPELINGELTGINVSGGDVLIEGAGLNASNVNKFDILTRAMQLNAALYADELTIRTGSNDYNFHSGQSTENAHQTDSSPAYHFALDASALGAMYANSISLVGTEAGLGVRSEGLIHSTNDLQLTADGQLQIKHAVAGSSLGMTSTSAHIVTSGTVYGDSVKVELPGTLTNNGLLAAAENLAINAGALQQHGDVIAGINIQGEWLDSAKQQLNILGEVVNEGRIISQGQQQLSATHLQNTVDAVMQADTTSFEIKAFENQGVLNTEHLTVTADIANSSGHIQAQQLDLNIAQLTLSAGALYQVGENGQLNFNGQILELENGTLIAEGAATLHAAEQFSNHSSASIAGDATIAAGNIVNNGTAQFLAETNLTADNFQNTGNVLFSQEKKTNLQINDTLNNLGLLQFNADTSLSAATIRNDAGQIYHLGSGELSLQSADLLSNVGGAILSNGTLLLSAPQLENQQGSLSAEHLTLSATDITSEAGSIQGVTLDVSARNLNNHKGSIVALGEVGESLQLGVSDTVDNSQGTVLAKGQQITFNGKRLINNEGSFISAGADGLTIAATEQLQNNQGLIFSDGELTITTPLLNNTAGEISAESLSLDALSLNNQQGIMGAQQVVLTGTHLNNQTGSISAFSDADNNLSLNFIQSINNSGQGVIQSAGSSGAITTEQLDNTDGNIVLAGQNGALQVNATILKNIQGQIQSNGELRVQGNQINNQSGHLSALRNLNIAADEILNATGQLQAASDLSINTQGLTNTDGIINSQQNLQLVATQVNNHKGVIQSANALNAQVHTVLDNQQGQLLSGGDLQLDVSLLNNAQGSVLAGKRLNLTSTELQNTAGGVISAEDVNIVADTLTNGVQARIEGQQLNFNTPFLDNAGTILAAGQQSDSLIVKADVLNNQGRLESHGESLALNDLQLNNQQGQIYHLGNSVLQIRFLEELNNKEGEIYSAAQLNIAGGNINNVSGTLMAQQSLAINAAELNNTQGDIEAAGNVAVVATALDNSQGRLAALSGMQLAAQQVDNTSGQLLNTGSGALKIETAQALQNNQGQIYSAGQLSLEGASLDNRQGEIQAKQIYVDTSAFDNRAGAVMALAEQGANLNLQVDDVLDNREGTVFSNGGEATVATNSLLNANGTLLQTGVGNLAVIASTLANTAGGVIASDDTLSLNADFLQTSGQLNAQQMYVQTDVLENTGAIETGNLHVNAAETDNSGLIAAQQQLVLDIPVLNNSGNIFSENDLTLATTNLDNEGVLAQTGAGVFRLEVLDSLDNQLGQIISEGELQVAAGSVRNAQGMIQARTAALDVTALNNNDGTLLIDQLELKAANLMNNNGLIAVNDSLALQVAQTLDNTQGELITTAADASIDAANIINDSGLISQRGEQNLQIHSNSLSNNGGTLHGAQQLDISAIAINNGGLINADTLRVTSDSLLNTGTMQAANVEISSLNLLNQGLLLATGTEGDTLQINAANGIVNQGHMQSHGKNLVLRDVVNNDGGNLVHAGSGELHLSQLSNQQGSVYANNAMTVAGDLLNLEGTVQAQGALNISGNALDNRSGVIRNSGNLTLGVTTLDNRGGDLSSEGESAQLRVADSLQNAGGSIVSAAQQLDVQTAELALGDGIIAGNGQVNITAEQLNLSEGGQLRAEHALQLNTSALQNQGVISATNVGIATDGLDNQRGVIEAANSLQVTADYVHNASGSLISGGDIDLNLQGQQNDVALNNNDGQIIASGDLTLTTPYSVDNIDGKLLSEQQLQLHANALNNSGGEILAANGLDITLAGAANNSGGMFYVQEGDLTLTAQSLRNDLQGQVLQRGAGRMQLTLETLHNSGEIGAGTVLALTAQHVTNSGAIQGSTVELTAQQLRNSHRILGDTLTINSDSLDNTDGILAALATDGALHIRGAELNNQRGLIQSHGDTLQLDTLLDNQQGEVILLDNGTLNVRELVNNQQGQIVSEDAIAFLGSANNNEGVVQATTDLLLQGTTISNNAGVIHAGGELNINGDSLLNQDGKISSIGNYQLVIDNAIDNSGNGVLTSAGTMAIVAGSVMNDAGLIYQQGEGGLSLTVDTTLNNNDGTVAADAEATITADEVSNNGGLFQADALEMGVATLFNNAGNISSFGDLHLTSTESLDNSSGEISALVDAILEFGQLDNTAGRISSSNALILGGGAVNNKTGSLMGSSINMALTGALNNHQATLFATDRLSVDALSIDNSDGTLAADGDVQLNVATQIGNSHGLIQAAGSLAAGAQSIDNTTGTIQATTAHLNSQQSINNTSGTLNAQTLSLNAKTLNNSSGVILATDTVDNSLQISGVEQLNNTNGTLASHGSNWDFSLGSLDNNNGKLLHLGDGIFTLTQAGNLVNRGTIASQAKLVVNTDTVNNNGTLQAQQQLQLNAGLANQAAGKVIATDVTVNASGKTLTNAGTVSAARNLDVNAANLNNSHLLYSGNNAQVNASNINNSGNWSASSLNIAGFTQLQNTGRIESSTASFTGSTLLNQGSGVLVNAGTSSNSFQLNVAQLTNSGTLYNSGRDMSIGGDLSNSGSIVHAGTGNLLLGINGNINNTGGSIATAGTATLKSSVTGAGTVFAEKGMLLNSSGTFINNSQLYTKGNMQVNSALNNQGGSLLSDQNLNINTSGSVTNTGTLQGNNLSLTSGALNNNGGVITSMGSSNAFINTISLSNSNGIIQATNNSFTISTRSGELNNSSGQIRHSGTGVLKLDSASNLNQQSGLILSTGTLVATAKGNVNNTDGEIEASQYQLTSSGTFTNNNGQLLGTGNGASTIKSSTLLNRSGEISANGSNLTLNTGALDNSNGSILLAGTGNLAITATSVNNNTANSSILSNGAITLNGGSSLNNAGVVSAAGALNVVANNINNSGILASRTGKLDINSTGTLTNSRTVSGATAVDLSVSTLNNTSGSVQSDGVVDIAADTLSVGNIFGRDVALSSNNNIVIKSGEQLSASRNLELQSQGDISNGGNITASGTLSVDAIELSNNSAGVIRAGGNAELDLNRLTNNGIISSNTALTVNAFNTLNNGTLAAGSHLDINGNITNSNLLFASNLLAIDGNVSNTGNIYSNQDATISGATVTNIGGTIAAARDLSISGTILNTYTGTFSYAEGETKTTSAYTSDHPLLNNTPYYGPTKVWTATKEERTTTVYEVNASGQQGTIASGRNMTLSGEITNRYSTISAGGDLVLSGTNLTNENAQNKEVSDVTVVQEVWKEDCLQGSSAQEQSYRCYEPGHHYLDSETVQSTYTETTFNGGSNYGTIVAGGNISGNLSGSVQLNEGAPLEASGNTFDTNGKGSSGSASRGSSASDNNGSTVAVNSSNGNAKSTRGASRSVSGVTASSTGTVNASWRDNNTGVKQEPVDARPDNISVGEVASAATNDLAMQDTATQTVSNNAQLQGQQQQVKQTARATLQSTQQGEEGSNINAIGAPQVEVNPNLDAVSSGIETSNPDAQLSNINGDSRQLYANDKLQGNGQAGGASQPLAIQGDARQLQITDPARQQAKATQDDIAVQDVGFVSPDMAASLRLPAGSAPPSPGQQQGDGLVSNGNIDSGASYNPDLIIKGLVDNQQGTLAQQQSSSTQASNSHTAVAGQPAGQNVFITDAQMRVLTEDLGFDADAINKGQQVLYAAVSQNDLLADGVTLSAGGTIDITADTGFTVDSGIAAGEGLILRSEAGLEMGSLGFFDSDNLLGLQLGGDFTNTLDLQSDTLWLDIEGDFTNLASLTGNDALSIRAGNDVINQNLLSGGHVQLEAGGNIINRTEFSQRTAEFDNGNSLTYTSVGNSPQIDSRNSLSMTAGNNIDLQGSQLSAAGDISLNAGNDVLLGAIEKVSGHEKYFKGGHDIKLDRTYEVVSLEAGGNLNVVAGNNLQSEGAQFTGGGDVELAAGNEMNLLGVVEYHEDRDKRTKKSTFKKTVYIDETYSAEHQGSVVVAGGNVSLNAQQSADGLQLFNSGDVLLEGTYLQAGGDVVAYSGGEMNVVSGEEWQAENHIKKKSMFGGLFGSSKTTETDVQYLGHTDLNASGDVTLLAQSDINVLAGRINAGNIIAQAGFGNETEKAADINILGDTETSSLYQETRRNGLALGFSDNFLSVAKETANENRITQTDYIGSAFTAKNNMALSASRDVNVVGSELHAGNNLQVDAGRDINLTTGQGSGSSYSRETETKTGIAVSADSNALSVFAGDDTQKDALTSSSVTQTGSTLTAGNNVQLNAGNDLLISGSDVVAGQDANLSAANDIKIVTAEELFNQEARQDSIRDGLTVSANYNIGKTVDAISNLGQGGDAVSVASSAMQAADTLNNAGPSMGAHVGQTTETTTDAAQQSQAKTSSLTAGRDVTISAGGDALLEGVNASAGRDIGINAKNVSIVAAQNSSDSQHNTQYQQVGLNLNANSNNVSLTAGFSQADSELINHNTGAVGSSLNAGGNVDINAQSDVAIVGSDINGNGNVALTAGNDITIKAAESHYSSNSEDSHLSVGAGINFGSNGIGVTANMAMGEGELDREGTSYSNSHITAGNNLSVTSGNDTVIKGGNLAGTDVAMDVGGDLTVASVQDTGQVKGDRWDISANITVGAGVSGGASVGYGETDGSSAWVNEQSSIIGSGSVDIRTEGHTQIDGAVIANIDEEGNDAGNLTLNTGTLAYSDVADHDQETSTYLNVGFNTGDDTRTNQSESGTNTSASGHYNNHDKEQINRATVGEGSVVVRDNAEQDISDLNRDVDLAQDVTKDDSQSTNLYASTTAADSLSNLAENPEQQLNQWQENVASVGSAEAWGQVGESATDALEDTYNAGSAVAGNKNLGAGDFWTSLDSTHKITQLKNDLTRTAEGQAVLARLTSDDPEQRLAAETELGHLAQEKFGIEPGDIHFYAGSETQSESLASSLTMEVKGATVSEEGQEEYGNIYIDVENADDALDLNKTLGHEVYESVTLQTGGVNDETQEAIAGLVGEQLASRLDDALDGGLGDINTSDLANTNIVQTGTQQSNAVGGAEVEYNNACLYANICNSRDQAEADMLSLWRSDDPKKQAEGARILSVLQEYNQLQKEDASAFFDKVEDEGIAGAIGSMLEESYEGLKAVADNPELLKAGLQKVEDDLIGKNGEAQQMLAWDNLNQSLKTAAITLPVGGGLAGSAKTLDNVGDVVNQLPDDVIDGGASNALSGANLSKQLTAMEVAKGHAFDKHVLKQGEFPSIRTRQQFQNHVEDVLSNPSGVRYYKDGRAVYLQESSGTVVIRNSGTGESTAFQPANWSEYINSLPSRSTPHP